VQADLEAQGYEVFPYVLPAASVNAPHRRDRVWFIAYSNNNDRRINIGEIFCESSRFSKKQITSNSNNNGLNQCYSGDEIQSSERGFNALGDINESNGNGDVTDTTSIRFSTEMENGELERRERFTFCNQRNKWDSFPTVSPLCPGNDGLSNRLDSITFSKWRKESIKAGGNAIVPQVAFQIFKTIEQFEQLNKQA
jgi:DNA (cytosine-5)-methyltransferase 1